jgi:hypothetical protein
LGHSCHLFGRFPHHKMWDFVFSFWEIPHFVQFVGLSPAYGRPLAAL